MLFQQDQRGLYVKPSENTMGTLYEYGIGTFLISVVILVLIPHFPNNNLVIYGVGFLLFILGVVQVGIWRWIIGTSEFITDVLTTFSIFLMIAAYFGVWAVFLMTDEVTGFLRTPIFFNIPWAYIVSALYFVCALGIGGAEIYMQETWQSRRRIGNYDGNGFGALAAVLFIFVASACPFVLLV